MRLSLIADDEKSTPVATAVVDDHPDKAALQEGLDEIARQAQWRLVEAPEQAAKDAEAAVKNQSKAAEEAAAEQAKLVEAQQIADEQRRQSASIATAPVPERKSGSQEQSKSSSQKV